MTRQGLLGAARALAVVAALGCGGRAPASPSATAPTDGAPASDGRSAGGAPRSPAPGSSVGASPDAGGAAPAGTTARGFPERGPWVSFYGPAAGVDLARTAEVFRVVNVDADPDAGNLSDEDLRVLRAGGKNRVLSYMNVGACEEYRSYFATAPAGFASCKSSGAATTRYSDEYPDEVWMDLSNAAYRRLVVEHVAARLAARVDGFYLDNLEVLEHGAGARLGPCGPACVQGGLDLVWELRQRYPDKLIVMQNATSDATRRGVTHGAPFPSLLDGVAHEEVYGATADPASRPEMLAWRDMRLAPGGRPFWLAAEEYVGGCSAALVGEAGRLRARARADGIEAYVTDGSGAQAAPCFALR